MNRFGQFELQTMKPIHPNLYNRCNTTLDTRYDTIEFLSDLFQLKFLPSTNDTCRRFFFSGGSDASKSGGLHEIQFKLNLSSLIKACMTLIHLRWKMRYWKLLRLNLNQIEQNYKTLESLRPLDNKWCNRILWMVRLAFAHMCESKEVNDFPWTW